MMRSTQSRGWTAVVLTLALGLVAVPAIAGPPSLAAVNVGPHGIDWLPSVQYEKIVLTVTGPEGFVLRREFAAGAAPSFNAVGTDGLALADGFYHYELAAAPVLDRATRRELAKARQTGDDSILHRLRAEGKLPGDMVQSGSFKVAGGTILQQDLREAPAAGTRQAIKAGPKPTTAADQVIPDDLIVQGSLCVGFDCVNNESFGFDTIRLKENNTRIKFEDTSVGTFPTNDWQLTANDSASGGASKFSIEDITGSRVPFTISAGASTNSIFVDSTGRVGFRTSTPVLDLHVNTSNTPAIRLEQNNSGGFTAQTWDIGANEANFFIRDVTGGSRLSFRIRPGAPTSSIDISADGDVGIGTASPDNSLHVLRSDGTAKLFVEETSGTTALRNMFELRNNGGIQMLWNRTDGVANDWQLSNFNTTFEISVPGSSPGQFSLNANGNLAISGTLSQGSSRDLKTDFAAVDPKEVLARVGSLPVSRWSYKTENGVHHVGPMAEDFHEAFGLGMDNKHIAPGDTAGVALVAVQGLNQIVQEKDAAIAQLQQTVDGLQQQNSELAARLATIEKLLEAQPK